MSKKGTPCFAVYPYLHQLIIFAMCAILLCTALCIYFLYTPGYSSAEEFLSEAWFSVVIVLCPLFIFFAVCIYNSYEYLGKILIDDSQIICYAPFKKTLFFKYSEIRDIGFDYAWLSGNRQYWIYLCIEKIPSKCWHRINRLPIGQKYLRFQFSEDVFHSLLAHLPDNLMKSLSRSKPKDI